MSSGERHKACLTLGDAGAFHGDGRPLLLGRHHLSPAESFTNCRLWSCIATNGSSCQFSSASAFTHSASLASMPVFLLPAIERLFVHPVFTDEVDYLRTRVPLVQYRDDLIVCEPAFQNPSFW